MSQFLSIKHFFVLFFFLFFALNANAKKRALLVAISNYSTEYSWPNINSTNDLDLIKPALKGFMITELTDSKATYSNIIKSLDNLLAKTVVGDIVYLHFSGHGQPFEDKNGDEEDGWDESFVPYDAAQVYGENGYHGDKHLLDDEIGKYISAFRKKVGKQGFVYLVIDACHSGTISRDQEEEVDDIPERGSNQGFSENKFYRPKKDKEPSDHYLLNKSSEMGDVIVLEACGPNQKNKEVKVDNRFYGPLSVSVSRTILKKGLGKDKEWISDIKTNMKELFQQRMVNQNLVVETSIE